MLAACAARHRAAAAADTPGVTATEIKIGNTVSYSGAGSSYGVIGRLEAAFFKMVNENGGVGGRKINFISYDDGLSPPKTVEAVRRLVEDHGVAFLFGSLGTSTNSAIVDYVNRRRIPHLFLASPGANWSDYQRYPWTMGTQPSARTEAQVLAQYIERERSGARIAFLYQNDDLGKGFVTGLKDAFGDAVKKRVVMASYEATDPTVDSQISALQDSGATVLIVYAIAKFTALAIRKVYDNGWRPLFLVGSATSYSVLKSAGLEKSIGLISAAFVKDPLDPSFRDDPGMQEWRAFMAKYMPGADMNDSNYVYAYTACVMLMQVLRQCNGDFSRENIMHQAESLHDIALPTLLPGIKVTTGPTEHRPIKSLQMQRFDGQTWVRFGDVIEGVRET
jgi:branched-chain amino acid transport system substrate-binding protein